MGTTKSNNMRCTIALILVAVLIAPAHSTSLAGVTVKIWTAADCSGTATLIEDKFRMNPPTDGSCMEARNENEDSDGNKFDPPTYETFYMKATCTANTATNGWSSKRYTDRHLPEYDRRICNSIQAVWLRIYKRDCWGCVVRRLFSCRLCRLHPHRCWLLCCQLLRDGIG